MNNELTLQILDIKQGDHLCLVYDEDPGEQMGALVPYIRQGLEAGEQCIYIADDQTTEDVARVLERRGINVRRESERKALRLWTRREWRQPGELDSDSKSLQVRRFIDDALKSGFKGVRFAVEMTWTLAPDIGVDRLKHWESTLNTLFGSGIPGRIVCQYSRRRLAPSVIQVGLQTHPLAILGDQLCSNFFYGMPTALDGGAEKERSDRMIFQLKQARAIERQREEAIWEQAALAEMENIRKLNAELEQRVIDRTAELEVLNRELMNEISERRKAEEKLKERERLAAMGATAAVFAHEIGNPLNGISTSIQLLERHFAGETGDRNGSVLSTLKDIQREISRLSSLLHEFRSLSRPQRLSLERIDLARLVREALAVEEPQYAAQGIRVEIEFPADLPPVMVDGQRLKQALLNLCKNAVEAMQPAGGILTVRGEDCEDRVILEVKDTGNGIPEGVDIFELFTTTKPQGTGLGLAIVRQIISAHGGTIRYTSEAGQGTAFRLTLPTDIDMRGELLVLSA